MSICSVTPCDVWLTGCFRFGLFALQKRSILPETAFIGFKNALQEPDETEGFDEIRRVNFKFQGTEEDRRLWSRWMS
jgi:hypothetical protein